MDKSAYLVIAEKLGADAAFEKQDTDAFIEDARRDAETMTVFRREGPSS